jgi:hypothetical protein
MSLKDGPKRQADGRRVRHTNVFLKGILMLLLIRVVIPLRDLLDCRLYYMTIGIINRSCLSIRVSQTHQ